jgi:hypothetical protein
MVIVEKSQNSYKVVTELPQSNYKMAMALLWKAIWEWR